MDGQQGGAVPRTVVYLKDLSACPLCTGVRWGRGWLQWVRTKGVDKRRRRLAVAAQFFLQNPV